MDPDALLLLFDDVATAVAKAVAALDEEQRRARTGGHAGQYVLDVAADEAALELLHRVSLEIVSEESGRSGTAGAPITVVIDPVDGSTNCARRIGYWATSLCAVDGAGPLASLVVNQATGTRFTAVRGGGAYRDGALLRPSGVRDIRDAVVALSGLPARILPWSQFRALGSAALTLCEVAAGALDGYVDGGSWHAPWDYLGGWHACLESGAVVVDAAGNPLMTTVESARRQLLAASTPELVEALRPAAGAK